MGERGDGVDPAWEVDASWELGQVTGWKDASTMLRKLAGEAFVEGRDEYAKMLRQASDTLAERAGLMRIEYDRKYKRVSQECY